MRIDKFIPRNLNTDSDERLLREGEMTDAVNVTLDEDGNNTAGVLKNVRGTRPAQYNTVADVIPVENCVVIGSVSDSQRNRIYFFVADADGNAGNDYVYMLDTTTDTYQIVFSTPSNGGFLNFNPNGFIKANVVNRDFDRNGTLESILYFTDNLNPPRKLNVDRAISGEYDTYNNIQLGYVLNSIKAAPTREPQFTFDTDEEFKGNNFRNRCFQFATQYIYDDGEESAISPYSRLAYVDSAIQSNVDSQYAQAIYASLDFEDNVLDIDTRFSPGAPPNAISPVIDVPTVQRIKILCREDNDGAWFILDEVSVTENTVRNIVRGSATDAVTIYNYQSGVYRWYNNGGYRTESTIVTDKLFDNVPLLARGQEIADNRLVYSNYEEGYNNPTPNVDISVNYLPGGTFSTGQSSGTGTVVTWITTDYAGVPDSVDDDGSIQVDFNEIIDGSNYSDFLDPGSTTLIQFTWEPHGYLTISGGRVVRFTGEDSNGDVIYGKMNGQYAPLNGTNASGEDKSFNFFFTYTAEEGDRVVDLANAFAQYAQNLTWAYQFEGDARIDSDGSDGLASFPYLLTDAQYTVGWKFVTVSNQGRIWIQPYLYVYTLNHPDLYVENEVSSGGFDPEDPYGGLASWWKWNVQSDFVSPTTTQNTANHVYTWDQSPDSTSVYDIITRTNSVNTLTTFKAGAMHEFGMMYYDEYNRNGPLMKIGSAYVQHPAERGSTADLGPATVTFDFNHDPPDWARSFKILYPGNSSFQSVWTGTVQNAFVEYHRIDHNTPGAPDLHVGENERHIYLSIDGVEDLQNEYGVKTSYDFSEGDILRVLAYNNDGTGDVLAESSNGSAPIVQFNVVKTVILEDNDDNPLRGPDESTSNTSDYVAGELTRAGKTGRFVVVQAPQVDAGIEGPNGNLIQYQGFDWFNIAQIDYPYNDVNGNQIQASDENRWKKEAVVEILTPINVSERSIYYEITDYVGVGTRRDPLITNDHGSPITVNNGDTYYRPVLCSVNNWNGTTWSEDPQDRVVRSITMESDRFSDLRTKVDWGKGRAHFALTEDQNRRRYNGITYSEKLIDDLNTNYLSSFDKNLVNYLDLNPSFGALNYIGVMGDRMVAAQENKVSRLSIGKSVLSTAEGQDSSVALSVPPFNIDLYYSGDYGIGDNPESALIQDNQFFFADVSRSSVLRLASDQLFPISEKRTSSLFENTFNNFRAYNGADARIVSGYDPSTDMYYITFIMGANSDTVGYSVYGGPEGGGSWISRYTFYPTNYSNQNNLMYSTLWNDPNTVNNDYDQQLFWAHDSDAYNTFYGDGVDASQISFVSKISPSLVKVFDAISYEGNSNAWNVTNLTTNLGSNGGTLPWTEREGSYYSYITRDTNGSKHNVVIGVVDFSTANGIVFQSPINKVPIQSNAEIFAVNGSNLVSISDGANATVGAITSYNAMSTNGGAINTAIASQGTILVAQTEAATDGDPIRGHWATIQMTNQQATQHELYCVNTVTTTSQVHHVLGQ